MRRFSVAACAVVVALSVYETANALWAPFLVATDVDWRQAAVDVRAAFRDGDLVTFAPPWVDPVGRMHLGDLMTREMVGRSDTARWSRLWVVSIRGARAPEAEGLVAEGEWQRGRVRVSRYTLPPALPPVTDFSAQLGEARVTRLLAVGGDEVPCLHDSLDGDAGFRCDGAHLGRRMLEIDYRPRLGVLVPSSGPTVTRLEWTATLGRALQGWTGIHDYYARKNSDGQAELRVVVDGNTVHRQLTGNRDGWKPFRIATQPGVHKVCLEVVGGSAPNLGFHIEARP